MNTITEIEMEHNWKENAFGRCIECSNCFNKDDWEMELAMFIDNITDDSATLDKIEQIAYSNQKHEGNGLCYECAKEIYYTLQPKTLK
jgi:hypothetical protein